MTVVIAIKGATFLCVGVTLATLRDIGKTPHLKDKLITFAKGILIVLLNTFNTFVGILLGPVAFLPFRLLIICNIIWKCVGVRKKFDCRGSDRKSEKCLLVLTILQRLRKLIKMITYYEWIRLFNPIYI